MKKNKKNILKNKKALLNYSLFLNFQINKFFKKNNFLKHISRNYLFKSFLISKRLSTCLISGKKKSINSYLKFNRSVSNSFVRFNYFPNIKAFGQ